MKYSLKQLFNVIDEKKLENEFYSIDTGQFGVDYYINLITYFEPNNNYNFDNESYIKIIEAYYDNNVIKNLDKDLNQIDVTGILIYIYIPHIESFEVFRVNSIKEAEKFMCSNLGLLDMYFIGDLVVLENGKRKKFFIKDFKGNILLWNDRHMLVDKNTGQINFSIEWENF